MTKEFCTVLLQIGSIRISSFWKQERAGTSIDAACLKLIFTKFATAWKKVPERLTVTNITDSNS